MTNDFTIMKLNGYAQSCGFDSEQERLDMILGAPAYLEDAVWQWMNEDNTKAGLIKILATKRPVVRRDAED
jgi:hypothetical protein